RRTSPCLLLFAPAPIGQPGPTIPVVTAFLGADPTPIPLPPRTWVSGASSVATSRPVSTGNKRFSKDDWEWDRGAIGPPRMVKVTKGSLMHYALVSLSTNWDWVVVYEQYYLDTLRPGLKALLGEYVGAYSGLGKGSVLSPAQGQGK
ncbi:hypothetical protein BGX38DRAFT_1168364, partial [Terfezia claveryi]